VIQLSTRDFAIDDQGLGAQSVGERILGLAAGARELYL
jgi:hypothetical protein